MDDFCAEQFVLDLGKFAGSCNIKIKNEYAHETNLSKTYEIMIWVIVPLVGILAPFCYGAYVKWVNLQKMRMKNPVSHDYEIRLAETEDALEVAQKRIENLESIVVSKLLEDPSNKDSIKIEASETISQNISE